jgi:hypothetical protein
MACSSRPVSTSTGISGCYQPHRQTAMPGQSLYMKRFCVYITSQYFFPAIIFRDIISHITITYRYIMYFFRTFKKSTAPYNVLNMGLRYIKIVSLININIFPGQGAPIILIYPEGPCNTYIQNRKKILSKVFFF